MPSNDQTQPNKRKRLIMALIIKHDPEAAVMYDRPVGIVQAVLSRVDDLGMSPDPFHEGKQKHQIVLTWQLKNTYTDKAGKVLPMQQSEIVNMSLNEKAKLRIFIEGMYGKSLGGGVIELDAEKLVGLQCMLSLARKSDETTYTKVVATAPLMEGLSPLAIVPLPQIDWIANWGKVEPAKDASSTTYTKEGLDAILAHI